MSDVNQKIMERSSGNLVINPDEQRYYLGTFQERVLATIKIEDVSAKDILSLFKATLNKEIKDEETVKVKISSQISEETQMAFLKTAKEKNLSATIIEEKLSTSPFGIVIYTDHAVNRQETNLLMLSDSTMRDKESKNSKSKKNIFKRIFGK
ncbi:DUF1694 domain-containing protein [Streptococcus thoraltensis]|uniref:DUF1694 domain-containing protein n=1 Tax=Streptococcus thoraltensis TaxID=55085 RepID=UPI00037186D4|nr:DUF1694 domain-containing protein [Streptococcus thoraltensis]MDY4761588.1 DUF1694 domain-containing protein [Streptococcus thoraltensis]